MKPLLRPLVVCLVVFAYSSCQKEPTSIPEPPATGDSTKLVKYITINAAGPTADTMFNSFEYDAQRRLTFLKTVYSSDFVDNSEFYSTSHFQYSGTDTLPNIVTTELHEGTAQDFHVDNDTSYFNYDTLGRLIKDSTNYKETSSYTGSDVYYTSRIYTYTGNEITVKRTTTRNFSGPHEYTSSFTATQINGNITALAVDNEYNLNLTYDSHPNPFYYIPALRSITSIISSIDEGEIIFMINTMQKNNCTGYSSKYTSGDTEQEVNTYSYNTSGLPATFTTQYSSSFNYSSYVNFKGVFEYEKW
jgi:hypothetical protein